MAAKHREPGAMVVPWLERIGWEPVAAPADDVARRLAVTVEEVSGCGVEPYLAADGRPLLSIHLVGVQLGLRPGRRQRRRSYERDRSARRRAAARPEAEAG
jgi:hypothetical protein